MANIKDVAKRAGVAISTVSKFINGGSVRSKNAAAIKKAIEELDYKVNDVARMLKTNIAMTVGVLIPSLDGLFFTTIAALMEDEFQKHGYSIILCDYRNDAGLEKEKLDFLISKRVDGLVIVSHDSLQYLDSRNRQGIPMIAIDRPFDGVDSVTSDSFKGSMEAIETFIEMGHNDIAIICGPHEVYTSKIRLNGYIAAMKNNNIKIVDEYMQFEDYTIEGGYKAMCELLKIKKRPTAIFTTNYELTLGAMMAINEQNIKVPNDISVIGFDDMIMMKLITPSLSVVAQSMDKIGITAAKLLIKRMSGDFEKFPQNRIVETSFIKRNSIKRIKT